MLGRARASADALALEAVGRRAPAGRDRAGARRAAVDPVRRRADRQPRQPHRRGHPRAAAGPARRRVDDRRDHARPRDRRRVPAPGRAARRGAVVTAADVLRTGALGLRTRRARAALSALGIAIGVASMVAVLGISESSKADLLAQIDRLGTNLLRVAPGPVVHGRRGGAAGVGRVDAAARGRACSRWRRSRPWRA